MKVGMTKIGTIMGRIGKREGEMISVTAAIPVVKTTPANYVELVRAIVMKTWTVNEAWCVEKTIVAHGAPDLIQQMTVAGIPVPERIVVAAETVSVKRVRATVTVTPIVRMI